MLLEIQSEPDTQTDGNSSGRHAITRRETWASTNAGSARNLYWPKVHSMVRPPDRGTWINTRSKERTSELGPARAGPSAPASFPAAPDRVCEGTPLSVPTASEPDPPPGASVNSITHNEPATTRTAATTVQPAAWRLSITSDPA